MIEGHKQLKRTLPKAGVCEMNIEYEVQGE